MDRYIDKARRYLAKLVSFKSVKGDPEPGAPFGKENRKALDFVLGSFEKLEAEKVVNMDGYCGYADFTPENRHTHPDMSKVFGILLHLDVVPVDDGWLSDPFKLTERDGKLYGRGSVDDKGPVAAIYAALSRIFDEGLHVEKPFRIIFGCDEESGWECMDHYAMTEEFPGMGIAPDACFPVIHYEKGILHFDMSFKLPSEIISIEGGDRANIVAPWARLVSKKDLHLNRSDAKTEKTDKGYVYSFKGKGAHASAPDMGENALLNAIDALAERFDEFKPISKLFSKSGLAKVSNDAYKASKHKDVKLTSNIGLASSERGMATLTIDVRFPKELSANEILEPARKISMVDRVVVKDPLYVDPEDPLVETLQRAYSTVTCDMSPPISIGGGTYARALPLGVSFGPVFPHEEELAHMANEFISVESLEKCIEIYYLALKELLFQK